LTARIELIYFTAGGGHRTAAAQLQNRAVLEVPEVLAHLLALSQGHRASAWPAARSGAEWAADSALTSEPLT
jgi:hypothetical protein